MARTWDSLRLRHQRAIDARLTAEHRQLARAMGALVLRAANVRNDDGLPIVPPSRRVLDELKAAIWQRVLKPYYIGAGDDPLRGAEPQSPYARLLVDGITEATRIQVQRQVALLRRVVRDEDVFAWLTEPRAGLTLREMAPHVAGRITELNVIRPGEDPITRRLIGGLTLADADSLVRPRGTYDPFHRFVDPNGYRLSDRVWRSSIEVRSRIDSLLDYHVAAGTSAVDIAEMLEPFMTPGGALMRTDTPYPPPYGTQGSYAARRLARTEITAAAGRATINAAAANPFVDKIQWRLSASHPKIDICDDYAHGGANGDGVYPIDQVPDYPPHPQCLCALLPVVAEDTADLVARLRVDIQTARGNLIAAASGGDATRANALHGVLNADYMTRAILDGSLFNAIMTAVRAVT